MDDDVEIFFLKTVRKVHTLCTKKCAQNLRFLMAEKHAGINIPAHFLNHHVVQKASIPASGGQQSYK